MRTANPALSDNVFTRTGYSGSDTMTMEGTATKSAILLGLCLITAGYTWNMFFQSGNPQAVVPYMMGGAFGGFICAMVTVFKRDWARITAPIYALLEGLFIGGISSFFEAQYPGLVVQAVGLTFGTLAAMLFAYKSGFIVVTDKLRMGIVAATGGIALIYFVSIILGFFGMSVPLIHSSGPFGILFSVFVVGIAAFNLVLDFDLIERGERAGAPKYMEWYGAFALMVTLVWLYVEILRLLAKMRDRR